MRTSCKSPIRHKTYKISMKEASINGKIYKMPTTPLSEKIENYPGYGTAGI